MKINLNEIKKSIDKSVMGTYNNLTIKYDDKLKTLYVTYTCTLPPRVEMMNVTLEIK